MVQFATKYAMLYMLYVGYYDVVERPFMFQWFIDDWILVFDGTCSHQLSATLSIFPDSYSGNLRYNDNNKTC